MHLDKLQSIATAATESAYKVRWLRWWNSSTMNKLAIKFPKAPVAPVSLSPWLNRASFYAGVNVHFIFTHMVFGFIISFDLFNKIIMLFFLSVQLEEMAVKEFNSIVEGNNITIVMTGEEEPDSLEDYLEKWRILLWDKAYKPFFIGQKGFLKSTVFSTYEGSELAMKRLLYRYSNS